MADSEQPEAWSWWEGQEPAGPFWAVLLGNENLKALAPGSCLPRSAGHWVLLLSGFLSGVFSFVQ